MGTSARVISPCDANFAANLRTARRARGLTLDALVVLMAETSSPLIKSGLSKAETGQRTITVGEAANLCHVLDVSLEQMIGPELRVNVQLG